MNEPKPPSVDVLDLADSVRDRRDFVRFLQALRDSFYTAREYEALTPEDEQLVERTGVEWQSSSVDQYLDCWVAWMEDVKHERTFELSWSSLAFMLWAAAGYE